MPQIAKPIAYRVNVIESERGWGQKIDDTLYFDSAEEAQQWVADFNQKMMPPLKPGEGVPDYYCRAEYCGSV